MERAYADAVAGRPSAEPILEATIPSVVDPSVAPPGRHVMSMFVQYAPYRLAAGSWEAERERFADRCVALMDRYAPGFAASVLHREVLAPPDLDALNKIDWRATPLLPGDFLFIWHGSWGNFDHMLVVNRVDSNQRAYAVTNYGAADGYLISEALLYDPADPTLGLFHQWTRQRDQILGSTGFGGYELWRRRSP